MYIFPGWFHGIGIGNSKNNSRSYRPRLPLWWICIPFHEAYIWSGHANRLILRYLHLKMMLTWEQEMFRNEVNVVNGNVRMKWSECAHTGHMMLTSEQEMNCPNRSLPLMSKAISNPSLSLGPSFWLLSQSPKRSHSKSYIARPGSPENVSVSQLETDYAIRS
jgi:hypothetical protein